MDYEEADIEKEFYLGFVYVIKNKTNNKIYIGQKKFWKINKLKPLKGKVNRRHRKVETKWKDYWGSSPTLLNDIEKIGKEYFTREIIYLCKTQTDLSIKETYEQINYYINDQWHLLYNEVINLRLRLR